MKFTIPAILLFSILHAIEGLESGYVKVCRHSFNDCKAIRIYDNNEKDVATYDRRFYDEISSIEYNLPVGTVFSTTDSREYTFERMLGTNGFDLVGTGKTERVSVGSKGLNDKLSSWTWFNYDTDLGYIEVFNDGGYRGASRKIFLSLYPPNKVISTTGWFLQDRASSIKFDKLSDVASVTLYQHGGSGTRVFANGWALEKQKNLDALFFNDAMSSFKWTFQVPQKEVIQDVSIAVPTNLDETNSVTANAFVCNSSPTENYQTMSIEKENLGSITTTVEQTSSFGWSVSSTVTAEKSFIAGSVSASLTASLQGSRSETFGRETSNTESISLGIEQGINIPAESKIQATFMAIMGKVPSTSVTTTATRWYNIPVTGSVRDPQNNNWYKRDEELTVIFEGDTALRTILNTNYEPLLDGEQCPI